MRSVHAIGEWRYQVYLVFMGGAMHYNVKGVALSIVLVAASTAMAQSSDQSVSTTDASSETMNIGVVVPKTGATIIVEPNNSSPSVACVPTKPTVINCNPDSTPPKPAPPKKVVKKRVPKKKPEEVVTKPLPPGGEVRTGKEEPPMGPVLPPAKSVGRGRLILNVGLRAMSPGINGPTTGLAGQLEAGYHFESKIINALQAGAFFGWNYFSSSPLSSKGRPMYGATLSVHRDLGPGNVFLGVSHMTAYNPGVSVFNRTLRSNALMLGYSWMFANHWSVDPAIQLARNETFYQNRAEITPAFTLNLMYHFFGGGRQAVAPQAAPMPTNTLPTAR